MKDLINYFLVAMFAFTSVCVGMTIALLVNFAKGRQITIGWSLLAGNIVWSLILFYYFNH